MYEAFRAYAQDKYRANDAEELESIFAGILAFIPTQLYGRPYEPLTVGFTREDKQWWQFWK